MTEQQDIATSEPTRVQTQAPEPQTALLPPVDIFEDAEGITVQAEMPGVSKERLNVQVDKSTLLMEGSIHIDMPEGMQSQYADVRSTHYRRSFALSSEVETDKIDANLNDGVLTVRIPKRAEARARSRYVPK
jgi:HSP20 family protein